MPHCAISWSPCPLVDDQTRRYFDAPSDADAGDQVRVIGGLSSRVGRSFVGEPEQIVAELGKDAAVRDADTVMIRISNELGVDFNARLLESIVAIGRELGW